MPRGSGLAADAPFFPWNPNIHPPSWSQILPTSHQHQWVPHSSKFYRDLNAPPTSASSTTTSYLILHRRVSSHQTVSRTVCDLPDKVLVTKTLYIAMTNMAILFDLWTNKLTLLGFIAHFITGDGKLTGTPLPLTLLRQMSRHSGVNISKTAG